MSYFPTKSYKKALASIRIEHLGGGSANLYTDIAAPSSITVDTSDWTEVFASTGATVKFIEIFDSTGEIMLIGVGPASSETVLFRVIPGGGGYAPIQVDGATRISIRAETATPSAGSETVINFFA